MLLKRLVALLFFLTAAMHVNAFTVKPIDGLWSIDNELGLAVGRAFNFELTGSVLVMTMYGYNGQRAPTFYAAAGFLDANNRMVSTMSEPTGGTCLGCSLSSGFLLSAPGTVTLEFTTSTTGFVTLPGEGRKSMRKGAIAWPAAPTGLYGLWVFTYLLQSNSGYIVVTDAVTLNRVIAGTANDAGIVVDATSTNGCAYKTSGSLVGLVLCTKLTSTGALDRSSLSTWWGDQMDGSWQFASNSLNYNYTAKRLTSPAGLLTITVNDQTPKVATDRANAMRAAMEEAERLVIQSLSNAPQ